MSKKSDNMLEHSLKTLGFSEKEAEIYLLLNRMGPLAASVIARLTQIKRTSVYDLLNALLRQEVIGSFRQGPYTYYYIDSVDKLTVLAREKYHVAEALARELKEEQKHPKSVQISHYKGAEGYREIYEHILRVRPKELMAWIHLDYLYQILDPEREEAWTLQRVAQKIHARLLLQDSPLARKFRREDKIRYRETHLIPQEYAFHAACFLYEGNIALLEARGEITGVRVEHPGLFEMEKQIFEMNWELFKTRRTPGA